MNLTNRFTKLTMIVILRALTNNYLWSLYPFETNQMHNEHPGSLSVCYQPENIIIVAVVRGFWRVFETAKLIWSMSLYLLPSDILDKPLKNFAIK